MRKAPWIPILIAILVTLALGAVGCDFKEIFHKGDPTTVTEKVTPPPRVAAAPTDEPTDEPSVESEGTVESEDVPSESAEPGETDEPEVVDEPAESEATDEVGDEPAETDEPTETGEPADAEAPDAAVTDTATTDEETGDEPEVDEPEVDEPSEATDEEPDAASTSTTATEDEPVIDEPEADEPITAPATRDRGPDGQITLTHVVDINIEQAAVDCEVLRSHVESAQRFIDSEEDTKARVAISAAIRSAAFVRAGLPSVQATQCLERAIRATERGRTGDATEAIDAAVNVSSNITLRGTVAEFRRRGAQANEQITDGDATRAREILRRMQDMIVPSDSEYAAARISDNLMGALSALDRDAMRPARAELTEADEKAFDLLRVLEGID